MANTVELDFGAWTVQDFTDFQKAVRSENSVDAARTINAVVFTVNGEEVADVLDLPMDVYTSVVQTIAVQASEKFQKGAGIHNFSLQIGKWSAREYYEFQKGVADLDNDKVITLYNKAVPKSQAMDPEKDDIFSSFEFMCDLSATVVKQITASMSGKN